MKSKNFQNILKNAAPTFLTILGMSGVVGTTISGIKQNQKACIAMKKNNDRNEQLSMVDKAVILIPIYAPTFLLGLSTMTCILGANILNKKNQASLASAYALIDNSYKEYRNKLIELHGEEADIEVRDAIARQHCDFHKIGMDIPDKKVKFVDSVSGRYIIAYEREIMDAEYHFNRNFVLRGYASLNEFYEFLGLPSTDEGEKKGWSISYGYYWIDFEHNKVVDKNGETYYVIDTIFPPEEDYMEDWE